MYSPDVWDRNLSSLIRSGAFNEKSAMEPMSAFKWSKLTDFFTEEGILDVFADGAEAHYYDEDFNLPDAMREKVGEEINANPLQSLSERYSIGNTHMRNLTLDSRLNQILKEEYTDKEIWWKTLLLLSVIIHTTHAMIEGGHSLRGLIDIGCMVRNESSRIDYPKLHAYLKRLGLSKAARLIGRFLISVLGFSAQEVPFAGKPCSSDVSLFYQIVVHPNPSKFFMLCLATREAYAMQKNSQAKRPEE